MRSHLDQNHARDRRRVGDRHPVINAMANGTGALLERLFIVVILPCVSVVAGYAFKVTMDNISLSIAAVAHDVADLKVDIGAIKDRADKQGAFNGALRDSVSRIETHNADTERRLEGLEKRK